MHLRTILGLLLAVGMAANAYAEPRTPPDLLKPIQKRGSHDTQIQQFPRGAPYVPSEDRRTPPSPPQASPPAPPPPKPAEARSPERPKPERDRPRRITPVEGNLKRGDYHRERDRRDYWRDDRDDDDRRDWNRGRHYPGYYRPDYPPAYWGGYPPYSRETVVVVPAPMLYQMSPYVQINCRYGVSIFQSVTAGNPSLLGSNAGGTVGTVTGGAGILGSLFGGNVSDRSEYCAAESLNYANSNVQIAWEDPYANAAFTLIPLNSYYRSGDYCRQYRVSMVTSYGTQENNGSACRGPNGMWTAGY